MTSDETLQICTSNAMDHLKEFENWTSNLDTWQQKESEVINGRQVVIEPGLSWGWVVKLWNERIRAYTRKSRTFKRRNQALKEFQNWVDGLPSLD